MVSESGISCISQEYGRKDVHECGRGEALQGIAGQPLRERGPNPCSGFCALSDRGQPVIGRPIFQVFRESFGLFPNLFDMGEKVPSIVPRKASKAEKAHHPLQGAGQMRGLIGYDSSIGEPEFERDGVVGCRRSSLVEETEQLLGLMMAS